MTEKEKYTLQEIQEILDKNVNQLVDNCAEQIPWDKVKAENKDLDIEEAKLEFKKKFREFAIDEKNQKRLQKSVKILLEHVGEYSNDKLCLKELDAASHTILAALESITPENMEKMMAAIRSVQTEPPEEATAKSEELVLPPPMAEALGISALTLDTFYKIGSKLYEEEKLDEAISVFLFLSKVNNYSHEVWLSLAMCHHRAHEYHSAIQAYMTAALWQPTDPLPYLYCCECFVDLEDQPNARESLQIAEYFLATNEDKERFAPLLAYCKSRVR